MEFEVVARSAGARRGRLVTRHGTVETPAFIPVATRGAIKSLTKPQVLEVGAQILLSNTYHLMLRPGEDAIAAMGGLHRFMAWERPLLTDSGGFQVASLADLRQVNEEGVEFRSHLDGARRFLSPEGAIEIQETLGADIIMVLDECVLYPMSRDEARVAAERSLRWAGRCREAHRRGDQALFGIVQGGVFPDLRESNLRRLTELQFPGYAIGGLAVGETKSLMYAMTELCAGGLPDDRPRYLMGVGTPADIVECVARGVDLFDCVLPTRNARNGTLFTHQGKLSIKNARFARDDAPLDPDCSCYTCSTFSRAYLRHLFTVGEMTAATLNTIHNLTFYLRLMERLRDAIESDTFENIRQEFRERLDDGRIG